VLAGDRDAVSGLINLVHQGPPGAWVESVDVADEAERPPPGFSIS
jgi:acylphosphatase